MKIGIIGAGAIGLLFGAYLAEENHEILFYVRGNKKIANLYIEKIPNVPEPITCMQVSEIKALYSMDLIVLAVKYHHLEQLKKDLDILPKHIPLLFVQNGLLHLSFIDQLKQSTIAIASVLHGAMKVNEYTVRHLGIGITSIGILRGVWDKTDAFLQCSTNNFPIKFTTQIEETLFKKALLNCLINPLTTILQVENGMLIKNESYKKILKNIYEELMEAFEEWREKLTWNEVVNLCKNTENNRSSMLTDYENGRLMEVNTIVGAVIAEAGKKDKVLPVLHTFYLMLKELNKVGDRHY
ncbi:ketopantoate reductase family protein [Psychrobacillus glaciei]|uniref:ketopantoate reductase family protein n=1 Tax=Psychrobacillus glaciei TaxID=2283160 RepID=UPI001CEF78EE|nr:2-dehydropantoate 2-reductase [Psychrobacillus glaciei]